jgi:rare lipoprotein A
MRARRFRDARLAGPLLLLLAACARPVAVAPPRPAVLGSEEVGLASWYGHPYHGRRTASGEVYDMNDLTAAHPTWPLGTRLVVTNLDNGRTAEVRVNDRGPFAEGRILDLSYAAARILGADRAGVIRVGLRVVALPGSVESHAAAGFTVQVGAFASQAAAEGLRDTIARSGEAATVSEGDGGGRRFYRVRVGSYADRPSALAAAEQLAARGYPVIIVER